MRRTAIATGLTLVTGLAINYATQLGPAWTRNPWVVWPLAAVLVVLTIVAVVAERRFDSARVPPVPAGAARLDSLRVPSLDVRVRGRDAELARLEELVNRPRGRLAVICGPGGIGKTTLAQELAARADGTVWWIRLRDRESFAAQLMEALDEPGGQPDFVWDILARRSRWLLVIDNVDRPQELSLSGEPLREYRGWVRNGGGGLLLITSRDTDRHTWGPAAELITLDPLSTEDAATVLLEAAPDAGDRQQAEALAARLGGFPLALRVAGFAVAQRTARHRTFDDYREALDAELGDILAARFDGPLTKDRERTLLRYTWELSLDQLADEGYPLARPILRMLSLAADAPLPRALITPELLEGDVTIAAVDGALAGLDRYGLIGMRTNAIPSVTLHPLIREINALLADEVEIRSWRDTLDRILLADADRTADLGRAGWDRAHLLAPHLAGILPRAGDRLEGVLAALDSLNRMADMLHDAGDAAGELRLLPAILDATLTIHGPDHVDTLGCRNDLAVAFHALGEHASAVRWFERTLVEYKRVLGPDHADTLGCSNNLAVAVHALGWRERAKSLLERTSANYERVLGPDHPDTLASRTNFAEALRDVGESEEAALLLEQTLADYGRMLGPNHPDTLRSRDRLATVLVGLGELESAVILHERTLVARERTLGPDHRNTVRSRARLAAVRAALERKRRGQRWRLFRKRRQ